MSGLTEDDDASTVTDVPNVEKTPRRTVRVDDVLWLPARQVASENDETITDVIVFALEEYVRRHRPDLWREYVRQAEQAPRE